MHLTNQHLTSHLTSPPHQSTPHLTSPLNTVNKAPAKLESRGSKKKYPAFYFYFSDTFYSLLTLSILCYVSNQPPDQEMDIFMRQTRKHARPMFYINCGYRDLCYCYSKITRHHYCCSCDVGACFPAHARLTTPTGAHTTMDRLRTGDQVLAVDESGEVVPSTVLGFMDRRPQETALYVTLRTASGQNLTLSPNHVLFKSAPNSSHPISVFGSDVNIGAYVPLTKEGTLLVEGMMVSCYASYSHSLAHSFLAPARAFPILLYLRPGFASRLIASVETLAASALRKMLGVLQELVRGVVGEASADSALGKVLGPVQGFIGSVGNMPSYNTIRKVLGVLQKLVGRSVVKDAASGSSVIPKVPDGDKEGGPTGTGGTCGEDIVGEDVADEGEVGEAYYISLVKVVGWVMYRKERADPQVLQVRVVAEGGLLQTLGVPSSLPQWASTILSLLTRSW
ncbi:Desert hedgehog protein A-like [Homarus americanus]|uniref:Desert hedgehog protein A-like n=1 Tax=Homarus americanus TaxID=6706 RepID=A0A8J5K6M3_HOMAM|nr:Desert hedgehog protein A-like [Homarus americanus]